MNAALRMGAEHPSQAASTSCVGEISLFAEFIALATIASISWGLSVFMMLVVIHYIRDQLLPVQLH